MSMEVLSRTSAQMAESAQSKTAGAANGKNIEKPSGARYASADEYAGALWDKYPYFGRTAKLANVPTTVSVSPAYLQKCANDPEKREALEKSLDSIAAFVPIGAQRTRTLPGSPVMTHYDCTIDANGNMTVISGCTNDPKVKSEWEKSARSGKKEKTEAERLAERRAKKRAEERTREAAKERAETLCRASGRDIGEITESLLAQMACRGDGRHFIPHFDTLA